MERPREPVGRGDHARKRVLSAALEVLADNGMPGFTMESVSRQAGASKATLYRHWPTASALLVDAMDAAFPPMADVDTGDLRTDLISLLTGFTSMLTDTPFPKLMAAFIDAAERTPALSDLHSRLTDRRRQPMIRLVEAATRRGELAEHTDPEVTVDLLASPFFYRRFVAHRPIPADMPTAVVDQVLAGLRPSSSRPPAR